MSLVLFSCVLTDIFIFAGDFNLNLLDYNTNRKVHNFLSLIYENGMIPEINKPTRVTRKTATIIDHILTNSLFDTFFKTVIFKSDISDHFPIWFLSQNSLLKQNNKENMFIYKRTYNTKSIQYLNKIENFTYSINAHTNYKL